MKKNYTKCKSNSLFTAAKRFCIAISLLLCLSGCGSKNSLDPKNPIVVSLWHYQDGSAKVQLDAQITKFNETVGKEQGIIIDAQSRGNSMRLAEVVFDAASKKIGSDPMEA
ncbi:MAG: hypothetical protein RSB57_08605, partial [Hungatella sp.]